MKAYVFEKLILIKEYFEKYVIERSILGE